MPSVECFPESPTKTIVSCLPPTKGLLDLSAFSGRLRENEAVRFLRQFLVLVLVIKFWGTELLLSFISFHFFSSFIIAELSSLIFSCRVLNSNDADFWSTVSLGPPFCGVSFSSSMTSPCKNFSIFFNIVPGSLLAATFVWFSFLDSGFIFFSDDTFETTFSAGFVFVKFSFANLKSSFGEGRSFTTGVAMSRVISGSFWASVDANSSPRMSADSRMFGSELHRGLQAPKSSGESTTSPREIRVRTGDESEKGVRGWRFIFTEPLWYASPPLFWASNPFKISHLNWFCCQHCKFNVINLIWIFPDKN